MDKNKKLCSNSPFGLLNITFLCDKGRDELFENTYIFNTSTTNCGLVEQVKKIILWASGSGSNVENIYQYFQQNRHISVAAIFTNKADAGVIQRMQAYQPIIEVYDNAFFESGAVDERLAHYAPDLIVLAGFLRKIAPSTINLYPNKIINIHPALLPHYGGKGMYGMRVHQAVYDQQETQTGITIHYVNEHYDNGAILFQQAVPIQPEDTPEDIAQKVHDLEYQYYPKVIEELLTTS